MRIFLLSIGLAAVVAPSAALAQSRPTTSTSKAGEARIQRESSRASFDKEYSSKVLMATGEERQLRATKVADCILARAKGSAGTLVGGPLSKDPEYKALAAALASRKYDRCLAAGSEAIAAADVNAALIESLLKADMRDVADRPAGIDVAAAKAFYAGPRTLESVGRCLAAHSTGLAHRVVRASPGSPDEAAALARLYAGTPECGLKAAPANLSIADQRGAVAAGLYHWTHRS